MTTIKPLQYEDVEPYIALTKKEGMAGFSRKADYYGIYLNGVLAGFTSVQFWSNKAKFNNHYVFRAYRRRGLLRQMFLFSLSLVRERGIGKVEAACTDMSLPLYLEHGARIVKKYKICTNVELPI